MKIYFCIYRVFILLCLFVVTNMEKVKTSPNSTEDDSISFVGSTDLFKGQLGSVAYLECSIINLSNMTMAWVRMRDTHILTVDRETFISDRRFSSVSRSSSNVSTWVLILRSVDQSDAGWYECQVSSTPKMSKWVQLEVVVPEVKIKGPEDMFVTAGSDLAIECVTNNVITKPEFVTWIFNGKMLVDVSSSLSSSCCSVTSLLRLKKVSMSDEGMYTCRPAGTKGEDRIVLHVLQPPVVEERMPSKLAKSDSSTIHMEIAFLILACVSCFIR